MYAKYLVVIALLLMQSYIVKATQVTFFVSEHKTTPFEKYITSKDAYKMVSEDPYILFIDVRDPIEITQSGHPENLDAIVPFRIQTNRINKEHGGYVLVDNPAFLKSMAKILAINGKSKHDMIIITCGSGRRSAQAVRVLAKNGYTNVWHITDGYTNDEKPGLNEHNAWQLQDLPWTYDIIRGSEWIKLIEN